MNISKKALLYVTPALIIALIQWQGSNHNPNVSAHFQLNNIGLENISSANISSMSQSSPTCSEVANSNPGSAVFQLNDSRNIRYNNMNLKGRATSGSCIIVPQSIAKQYFGSEKPTAEQFNEKFKRPWLQPRIPLRRFSKDGSKDYFMPVKVIRPDQSEVEGQLALGAAFQSGNATYISSSNTNESVDPNSRKQTHALAPALAMNAPSTGKESQLTQGKLCETCSDMTPPAISNLQKLANANIAPQNDDLVAPEDIPASINGSYSPAPGIEMPPIWQEFLEFSADFYKRQGRFANRFNSKDLKARLAWELIQKFGTEKATTIVLALTSYKETTTRKNTNEQIADLAVVGKIIKNRADTNYRVESETLKEIEIHPEGSSQIPEETRLLSVALAKKQFSVWNNGSDQLVSLIKINESLNHPDEKKRLALGFVAIDKLQKNEIEFSGELNNGKTRHYHSNQIIRPIWAYHLKTLKPLGKGRYAVTNNSVARSTVNNAKVKVHWSNSEPQVVDLNALSGAGHIFYTGVN